MCRSYILQILGRYEIFENTFLLGGEIGNRHIRQLNKMFFVHPVTPGQYYAYHDHYYFGGST